MSQPSASSAWYVVLGSVLSIIGSGVSTWLTLRAAHRRERLAWENARQTRSDEYQVKTLMEVQDALGNLGKKCLDASVEHATRFIRGKDLDTVSDLELYMSINDDISSSLIALARVQSRLYDSETQILVDGFIASAGMLLTQAAAENQATRIMYREDMINKLISLHKRIGNLLIQHHGIS